MAHEPYNRWADQLGPLPWGSLSPADEQRYRDFIELSTCQVVAGAINIKELLDRPGPGRPDRSDRRGREPGTGNRRGAGLTDVTPGEFVPRPSRRMPQVPVWGTR